VAKKIQYQICVSGAALGSSVKTGAKLAAAIGTEIAKRGHITLTGATKGLPYEAARAAQIAGGFSMGFSPAASRISHVKKYHLPLNAFDAILFTGFEYTGRNLLLIRSSDAVVMVGGRIGTLNELTIAIEERKPIGVLLGSGGMTEEVEHVLKAARRARTGIIFSHDPADLLDQLIDLIRLKGRKLPEMITEN
jgi:uncharacterized protein (TIGR00725 family)